MKFQVGDKVVIRERSKRGGWDREHSCIGAGCGPDHLEAPQVRIHDHPHRPHMADGRDAPDGEARQLVGLAGRGPSNVRFGGHRGDSGAEEITSQRKARARLYTDVVGGAEIADARLPMTILWVR